MPQSTVTFGPYSPIRQAGDTYFVSGQVGVDPATKTAPAGATRQTAVALDNMRRTLETAGLSMDDVVKTTIYTTIMADFAAINQVYMAYFSEPRPARATVGVASLPQVANVPILVEIEAVAVKGLFGGQL